MIMLILVQEFIKLKKRAFYIVAQYKDKAVFDIITEKKVKNILEENNDVYWYEKLFGKLEEAWYHELFEY